AGAEDACARWGRIADGIGVDGALVVEENGEGGRRTAGSDKVPFVAHELGEDARGGEARTGEPRVGKAGRVNGQVADADALRTCFDQGLDAEQLALGSGRDERSEPRRLHGRVGLRVVGRLAIFDDLPAVVPIADLPEA